MSEKKHKKQLVDMIIQNLIQNPLDWSFDKYCATNKKSDIFIWIANIPILNISIYKPTKVTFNLLQKYRLYKAMDKCRSLVIMNNIREYEPLTGDEKTTLEFVKY